MASILPKLGSTGKANLVAALDSLTAETLRLPESSKDSPLIRKLFLIAKKIGEGIKPDLLRQVIVNEQFDQSPTRWPRP